MINIFLYPPQLLRISKTVIFFALSSIFWQCYGAASASSEGASGTVERPAAIPRTMGVEIETSSIKINNSAADKVGFTLSHPLHLPRIILEEDTLDGTFSGTQGLEDFSQNIECKTVGGFEREDLLIAARHIQLLLENLYTSGRGAPATFKSEVQHLLNFVETPQVA